MDKRKLVKDMEQFTGSAFITKTQLMNYCGKSHPRYIQQYVEGLEKLEGKYYFIPDVAAIMNTKFA